PGARRQEASRDLDQPVEDQLDAARLLAKPSAVLLRQRALGGHHEVEGRPPVLRDERTQAILARDAVVDAVPSEQGRARQRPEIAVAERRQSEAQVHRPGGYRSSCSSHMRRKRDPGRDESSSKVPDSAIVPSSRTKMRSQSRTVERRWAMTTRVTRPRSRRRLSWIARSDSLSSELVASSRTSRSGRR